MTPSDTLRTGVRTPFGRGSDGCVRAPPITPLASEGVRTPSLWVGLAASTPRTRRTAPRLPAFSRHGPQAARHTCHTLPRLTFRGCGKLIERTAQ